MAIRNPAKLNTKGERRHMPPEALFRAVSDNLDRTFGINSGHSFTIRSGLAAKYTGTSATKSRRHLKGEVTGDFQLFDPSGRQMAGKELESFAKNWVSNYGSVGLNSQPGEEGRNWTHLDLVRRGPEASFWTYGSIPGLKQVDIEALYGKGEQWNQWAKPEEALAAFGGPVGVNQMVAMKSGPTPPGDLVPLGNRTLKIGTTGEDVRNLQKALAAQGLYRGKIDGDFGPQTQNAVKAFQAAAVARGAQIEVDGKVGKDTRPLVLATMSPQAQTNLPGRLSDEYVAPGPENIFKRYFEGYDAPAATPTPTSDNLLSRMASEAAARSGIMPPDQGLSGSEMSMPLDPSGFPIDTSRPKLANPNGDYSTELTTTVRLQGGWYNVPTIVNGKRLSPDEAVAAIATGQNRPVQGPFVSEPQAVSAAIARSNSIAGARGDITSEESPLGILSGVSTRPPMRVNATGATGLGPVADARGALTVTPDATRLSRDEFLQRVMPDVPAGLANRPTFAAEPRGRLSPEFASQPPDPMAEAKARATAELRQQLIGARPPVPRPNPLDFSGAGGDVQRQVLDEATKRSLTRQLTGVDPRNLPVDAGTGGGVYGPRTVASAPGRLSPEYTRPTAIGFNAAPTRSISDMVRGQSRAPLSLAGAHGLPRGGYGTATAADSPDSTLKQRTLEAAARAAASMAGRPPVSPMNYAASTRSVAPQTRPTGTPMAPSGMIRQQLPSRTVGAAPAVGVSSKPIPTVRAPSLPNWSVSPAMGARAASELQGYAPMSMAGPPRDSALVSPDVPMYGMDKKFSPLKIGLATAIGGPVAGVVTGLGQALFGGTGTKLDMAIADAALRRSVAGNRSTSSRGGAGNRETSRSVSSAVRNTQSGRRTSLSRAGSDRR